MNQKDLEKLAVESILALAAFGGGLSLAAWSGGGWAVVAGLLVGAGMKSCARLNCIFRSEEFRETIGMTARR
jgi:hypothetical protein